MKTLKLTITVLAIVLVNVLIAQEKLQEVKSYKTQIGVKIATGMYFTILDGDHFKKESPNFWKISGGGRLPLPLKYFSFINRGNTYQIKRILKVTGKNVQKHYLVQFQSLHDKTYLYIDTALKEKEIEINKALNIDAIVKI